MAGAGFLVIAFYAVGPLLEGSFVLPFLVDVLLFGLVAMGLQHIVGGAGVLNLGQAAFFGLGAYGGVWVVQEWQWTTLPALFFAVAVALVGAVVMLPLLRLRGVYFAMATFAFGAAMFEAFRLLIPLTGGDDGIVGIPPLTVLGTELWGDTQIWVFVTTVVLLCYILMRLLDASGYGLSLQAARESEQGARAAGINVARMRIIAVMIGVVPAALAGTMYAQIHGFVSAPLFSYDQSVAMITMVIIGGVRSPAAAFVGALITLYLAVYTMGIAGYQVLIYGLLIAVLMVVLPEGLVSLLDRGRLAARRLRG